MIKELIDRLGEQARQQINKSPDEDMPVDPAKILALLKYIKKVEDRLKSVNNAAKDWR